MTDVIEVDETAQTLRDLLDEDARAEARIVEIRSRRDGDSHGAALAAAHFDRDMLADPIKEARIAHEVASKAHQIAQAQSFVDALPSKMAPLDESIISTIRNIESAVADYITASNARTAAIAQLKNVGAALGVSVDSRTEQIAGVSIASSRKAETVRIAQAVADVFRVPGLPGAANQLDAVSRLPYRLPTPSK